MVYRNPALPYIAVLLFALLTLPAQAQTATLRGTILDAETGKALPGANVVATSEAVTAGATSSMKGKYEIADLPAGTYRLTVSYIGFSEQVFQDIVLGSGEVRSVDVSLQPAAIQMNPIGVTASRRAERTIESPTAINVLDRTEIESQSAPSQVELVKGIPGVNFHKMGLAAGRVSVRAI